MDPVSLSLTAVRLMIVTDVERWRSINSDGTFVSFLAQHSSFDFSLFLAIFLNRLHQLLSEHDAEVVIDEQDQSEDDRFNYWSVCACLSIDDEPA